MALTDASLDKQIAPVAARPRVVDVVARHHAQALAVTTAGDTAALHCHTAHGSIVITVSLAVFIAAVRGPADANGRPFALPAADRRSIFEADAEAVRPGRKPRDDKAAAAGSRTSPARLAFLRGLYERRQSTPLKQLADEAGLSFSGLYSRFRQFEAADLAASARPPALKPSGKIL